MSRDLPGLREMKATAQPGECFCCGSPAIPLATNPDAVRHRLSGRTHQDTCGAPKCITARMKFWRRDARRATE